MQSNTREKKKSQKYLCDRAYEQRVLTQNAYTEMHKAQYTITKHQLYDDSFLCCVLDNKLNFEFFD